MSKLKQCPFCGRTDSVRVYYDKKFTVYMVECRSDIGCGAGTGVFFAETEAVEKWNTRHAGQAEHGAGNNE